MPLRPFRVVDVVDCKNCSVDRLLGSVCAFFWKNVCAAGSKTTLAQRRSFGAPCHRQRRGCARRAPEPLQCQACVQDARAALYPKRYLPSLILSLRRGQAARSQRRSKRKLRRRQHRWLGRSRYLFKADSTEFFEESFVYDSLTERVLFGDSTPTAPLSIY